MSENTFFGKLLGKNHKCFQMGIICTEMDFKFIQQTNKYVIKFNKLFNAFQRFIKIYNNCLQGFNLFGFLKNCIYCILDKAF